MRFPDDVPVLTDGVVTLRAHQDADIPSMVEQCRDPETVRWTTVPTPYDESDARSWIYDKVATWWEAETTFAWAIEAEGRYAGGIDIRQAALERAEVGFTAHPWARGTGHMERALRLAVGWAFDEGGFETVVWWANLGNWASRRLAWKVGFDCHGPVRGWIPQRGELVDGWVGTLRKSDPREPRHRWLVPPRLSDGVVLLRPQTIDDHSRLLGSFDEAVRRFTPSPPPTDENEARAYLDKRIGFMASGEGLHWAIADPHDEVFLGAVMVFHIESDGSAELGYFLHPDARGQGLTRPAVALAVDHAFGTLGLRKLRAAASVENEVSLHILETCGFTRFGVERGAASGTIGPVSDLAWYELLAD